jgi:cytochrome c oxidase subunit 1
MFGRRYNGMLAGMHFWLMFIGVNTIFFPQHFLGLQGMPRRYIDYPEGFAHWNEISTYGYYITMVSMVFWLLTVIEAAFRKAGQGRANPWGEGATTLEWTLPSPPPFHQFNELPKIK